MSQEKQPDQKPQADEIELGKKTLKDLPETGEDVKGGRLRKTTLPPTLTTVQC